MRRSTSVSVFAGLSALSLLAVGGRSISGCGGGGDDTASTGDDPGAHVVPGAGGKGGAVGAGGKTGTGGTSTGAGTGGKGGGLGLGAGGSSGASGGPSGGLHACIPTDKNCIESGLGPHASPATGFPLPSSGGAGMGGAAPGNVGGDGVGLDPNGFLVLDTAHNNLDFLWIADDMNYGMGLVSKVETKPFPSAPTYREVARYASFTCFSDATNGSKEGIVLGRDAPAALCADGIHGCCSIGQAVPGTSGPHQAINIYQNRPSRTAIDFSGDAWVSNRAHEPNPRQSSVTKIANALADCVDRNKNGKIDTSSDVNNDGIITTDCNEDNLPDDGSTACHPGKSHEFYGLDDECILFTTNTGTESGLYGRPLALGKGEQEADSHGYGPSDAWAGMWKNGTFFRIDGVTGQVKTKVQINPQMDPSGAMVDSHPYGAAIDKYGVLWAPNEGEQHLFWFDTNNPSHQGMVTAPSDAGDDGGGFYGIAVDGYEENGVVIQQVWIGQIGASGAYRYRPQRDMTNPWDVIEKGTWAHVNFDGGTKQGRGIGVDNRKPTAFAWVALDGGAIGRIPTNVPDGLTTLPAASSVFKTVDNGGTLGAGVAFDLDIWGVNQGTSSATHFKVDPAGNVVGAPDQVPLDDKPATADDFCGPPAGLGCKPHPYTYSDFTGFGLRNFTNPHGTYSYIVQGCPSGKTKWLAIKWDSDTPTGTTISVRARSVDTLSMLMGAAWTGSYTVSPADLTMAPGPLLPNPAAFMQLEFTLETMDPNTTPVLKGFEIAHDCVMDTPG